MRYIIKNILPFLINSVLTYIIIIYNIKRSSYATPLNTPSLYLFTNSSNCSFVLLPYPYIPPVYPYPYGYPYYPIF